MREIDSELYKDLDVYLRVYNNPVNRGITYDDLLMLDMLYWANRSKYKYKILMLDITNIVYVCIYVEGIEGIVHRDNQNNKIQITITI